MLETNEAAEGLKSEALIEPEGATLGRRKRKGRKKEKDTSASEKSEGEGSSTGTEGKDSLEEVKEDINTLKITTAIKKCSEILTEIDKDLVRELGEEERFEFTIELISDGNKYEWKVYHTYEQIKTNFEEIRRRLEEDRKYHIQMQETKDMFEAVRNFTPQQIKEEKDFIGKYYSAMFKNRDISIYMDFTEFLQISNLSFSLINGTKPMEGYAFKKVDPQCARRYFKCICPCLDLLFFRQYNRRWLVLTDQTIAYSDSSRVDQGKGAYWFDVDFRCLLNPNDNLELTIENSSTSLTLKFETLFDKLLWKQEIDKTNLRKIAALKENPYSAFATEKSSNEVKWFSDGEAYFADLYVNLMKAEKEVYITDWFLSPPLYLNRPVDFRLYEQMEREGTKAKELAPFTRLKDVLYYLASKKNVQIYIMVYCEAEIALTINSKYAKEDLESMHKNIHVITHPHDIDVLLWSHHEKLVVIDQMVGYVGGLDLCWGRYDTNDHPLDEPESFDMNYLFPGIDYSNARINDFADVPKYLIENVDRRTTPRMPWHDVHMRLSGPAVPDIARHFIQRWNAHQFEKRGTALTAIKSNEDATVRVASQNRAHKSEEKKQGWMEGILKEAEEKEKKEKSEMKGMEELNAQGEKKEEEPKKINPLTNLVRKKKKEAAEAGDAQNAEGGAEEEKKPEGRFGTLLEDIGDEKKEGRFGTLLEEEDKKEEEISKKPPEEEEISKKPPQEESLNIAGLKVPKSKEGMLFSQFLKGKIFVDKDHAFKYAPGYIPKTANQGNEPAGSGGYYGTFVRNTVKTAGKQNTLTEEEQKILTQGLNINTVMKPKGKKTARAVVQVLRSSCKWSAGLKQPEHSIMNGYYRLIDQAEHFIYIENQFFVSRSWDEAERGGVDLPQVVENQIAYHIRLRIERAINEGTKFKVIIFVPLLPGFAGEPEQSGTLQLIMKHSYHAMINNKGFSIIEKVQKLLEQKGRSKDEVFDYIGFYSLRNHAEINGVPVTEIIYIHSKLMIVDDNFVLIGSANINDRSMLGTRDSEFAVIVKDRNYFKSKMDGKEFKAANFAASFRKALMAEHIGLDPNDPILIDPLGDELNNLLKQRAENNAAIYSKVFNCYPDDKFKTFKSLREAKKPTGKELQNLYDENIDGIEGHVVTFPLRFLENEIDNFGLRLLSAEGLLPEWNYT